MPQNCAFHYQQPLMFIRGVLCSLVGCCCMAKQPCNVTILSRFWSSDFKHCIGPIGTLAPIDVAISSLSGCISVAIDAVSAIGSICAQSCCIMQYRL